MKDVTTSILALSLAVAACGSNVDRQPSEQTTDPTSQSSTEPDKTSADGSESPPDSSSGNGNSVDGVASASCENVTKELCEAACACTGSEECIIKYASATETHESLDDCVNYYRALICSESERAATFESTACRKAVAAATCSPSPEGTAVDYPDACRP